MADYRLCNSSQCVEACLGKPWRAGFAVRHSFEVSAEMNFAIDNGALPSR
jgi:hypothetical protein